MSDLLVPELISYARFLEVRARRRDIVGELTRPVAERAIDDAVTSGRRASDVRAFAAVRTPLE